MVFDTRLRVLKIFRSLNVIAPCPFLEFYTIKCHKIMITGRLNFYLNYYHYYYY